MKRNRGLKVLKIVVFVCIVVAVVSFVVMRLWNALMPSIFGLHTIGYWQALGLLVLSKLLFGGFRPGHGGGQRWRRRMMDRWEHMTPEEREKFKQGMRHGCGGWKQNEEKRGREAEAMGA